MSEVLEAIRKRLSDDFKSKGYEVLLLQELRELKRSKVADVVSSYCNYMKAHEIDALMDELDHSIYNIVKTGVSPPEKSPPELAAIGFEEERKKRGRQPRVVKEVTRDNGEPDAPVNPDPKSSVDKLLGDENGDV